MAAASLSFFRFPPPRLGHSGASRLPFAGIGDVNAPRPFPPPPAQRPNFRPGVTPSSFCPSHSLFFFPLLNPPSPRKTENRKLPETIFYSVLARSSYSFANSRVNNGSFLATGTVFFWTMGFFSLLVAFTLCPTFLFIRMLAGL